MFIDGIALAGYRSFGPELQKIGPFKKINLIIGQNNSGKSNILRFLRYHYGKVVGNAILEPQSEVGFSEIDYHDCKPDALVKIGILINKGGYNFSGLIERLAGRENQSKLVELLERFLCAVDKDSYPMLWLIFEKKGQAFDIDRNLIKDIANHYPLEDREYQVLARELFHYSGGHLDGWIADTIKFLKPPGLDGLNKILFIPAIREIRSTVNQEQPDKLNKPNHKFGYLDGTGLIEKLAELQNPTRETQHLRALFDQICNFARSVTGNNSIILNIPHDKKEILVKVDGRTLPLDSLGTGIHEVIILASAATVYSNQVICVEEPEIHMHPILQRKLIRYLDEMTTNQYIISTHSAHLIDTENAAGFHITLKDGHSIVDAAVTSPEKACICFDLGYRASDLMQSNCIIWVEGPSDRIYVNHWLKALDEDLIEGIHYSIMFYGGRLLNHLTVDDPEIEAFISLRRMNRNLCIIMDSDKSSEEKKINATKNRIVESFDDDQTGFAWVTQGREIENYLDDPCIKTAILSCLSKAVFPENNGSSLYNDWFDLVDASGKAIKADKIKVATKVCEQGPNFDILDLKERMKQLVKFIYKANGINDK